MASIFTEFGESFERLTGESMIGGVAVVISELSAGRPVLYEVVKTPEVFRLGVLGYFAALAMTLPKETELKCVISSTRHGGYPQRYLQDLYGKNKISAKDFLTAFGVSLREVDADVLITLGRMANLSLGDKDREKVLYICDYGLFESLYYSLKRIVRDVIPVVEDDGKIASPKYMSSRRTPA